MSTKNDAEVILNGKVCRLSGYESEDYLQKIASYINGKIRTLEEMESYSRLGQDIKNILLNINIADDYFKAKKQADFIENDSESRDKQLYDVKHELVSAQLKIETLEKELSQLKDSYDHLEKENIKLEAELKSTKEVIAATTTHKRTRAKNETAEQENANE